MNIKCAFSKISIYIFNQNFTREYGMHQLRMSGWLWTTDTKRCVAYFRVNTERDEELQVFNRNPAGESHPEPPYDEAVMVGIPPPHQESTVWFLVTAVPAAPWRECIVVFDGTNEVLFGSLSTAVNCLQ
jgi:hypothetical protein